jgi:transcription initiation factor TFIIIB Brf1 subunit/transcription initiation factor TFIIB
VQCCTECGFVVTESTFQDEIPDHVREGQPLDTRSKTPLNLERTAYWMKSSYLDSNSKLLSVSKRLGLQLLSHCAEHFRFNQSMREEALTMYRRAVNEEQFTFCSRETKMVIAGVCAFLTLNYNKVVITKHSIAKQVGCTVSQGFGAGEPSSRSTCDC